MLDGLDDDWNYVGQQRSANYTNIKPGDYIFSLKAANNDGYWTSEPKTIFIKVLSPWWLSWWAKFLYIIVFISLGYYIYRLIISELLKKKKALDLERGHGNKMKN